MPNSHPEPLAEKQGTAKMTAAMGFLQSFTLTMGTTPAMAQEIVSNIHVHLSRSIVATMRNTMGLTKSSVVLSVTRIRIVHQQSVTT
jgi:hypothetical protein